MNITARVREGAGARQTLATGELRTHLGESFQAQEKWIAVKHTAPIQVWEVATRTDAGKP